MTNAPHKGIGEMNGPWAVIFKVCLVIGPMFVSLGVAGQAWILNRLSAIDEKVAQTNQRIAVVEGNRFSSADGIQVWAAISGIREQLAKFPSEIPPQWVTEKLNRLDVKINELAILQAQSNVKRR